jgi:hypothetical protein
VRFVTVAEFGPPDAVRQLEEWRRRHDDALAVIPADEVVFDVGRAVEGGDFARARVVEHHAAALSEGA